MSIYQHFRPEEKDYIDTVFNWCEYVETYYAPKLTDFLNPREQFILRSVVGSDKDYKVAFFGGANGCERKRALIYPDYMEPQPDDFQISLFSVNYPEKFVKLKHSQILGSLTGLGLKRGKFGDILLTDDTVQFFTAKEISDYVRLHLQSIGRTNISVHEIPLTEVAVLRQEWSERSVTVSSLRLDAVLATSGQLSRQNAQRLIAQGQVKVNWKPVEDPSFHVDEGDIISARGIGRLKVLSIEGKTKKEKWRLSVGKMK